ncbi:hypothetical protein KR038_005854 [Drosophila bunnanda]|nr:hypothetical protein KR038_005854 [Drosophila bunnanda]
MNPPPSLNQVLLLALSLCQLLFAPESLVLASRINDRKSPNEVSLYSESDNVKMLDSESLRTALVMDGDKGKLVQFLNTFCGDCQRFAPIFKGLARDLYKWNSILRIYGVDCAQERNVDVCREFDIRQTPTLRYFALDSYKYNHSLGLDIPSQDPQVITSTLADFISRNEQPNFAPLKSDDNVESIFKRHLALSTPVKVIALVFQPKDSLIGRDTLLELLPYKELEVRIVDDPAVFANFGLKDLTDPKLAIIDREGNAKNLPSTEDTSKAYAAVVGEYLQTLDYKPEPPLPIVEAANVTEFLDQQNQAIIAEVLKPPKRVYRADLEQAIDKLLHIELPKPPFLEGNNLTALKNIITVVSYLNPLNKDGQLLLKNLRGSLGQAKTMTGSQFAETVESLEKPLKKVFKGRRYVGCIASRPFLRGFTCSLWTLFHFLTVEAAKPPHYFKPGSVLLTVHGFAKYFFGCSDCSRHFQAMAKRRRLASVKSHDEEILWLWEAHNEVNQRVASDSTEDPKFPKIQFPSEEDCPTCRSSSNSSEWQKPEVLKYLKKIYDRENLSFYGLPTAQGYN